MDAEPDELDHLVSDLSYLARSCDYRPTRLRQMRDRIQAWADERERDHADALSVAYSMGAADRRERTTSTQKGASDESRP